MDGWPRYLKPFVIVRLVEFSLNIFSLYDRSE
jgi:hypothetical protein